MGRHPPSVCTSRVVGLFLLVIAPSQVVAQAQLGGQPPLSVVVAEQAWSAPFQTWQPNIPDLILAPRADRSAAKTIATHTVVGTGAGLLVGLLLSGASAGDDQTSAVLTWTALGAAAGLVSGIVTWLVL